MRWSSEGVDRRCNGAGRFVGLGALVLAFFAVSVVPASADALVITRAMKAPTVMEVFIEKERVRVELEIGFEDLEAFYHLLPDELIELLELEPAPLAGRLPKFFLEDLTIRMDGGEPLPGRVESMAGRKRLPRDEITGEPLSGTGEEEDVLFVALTYPFEGQPGTLMIKPPHVGTDRPLAGIGFTTYHLGLPIMDFRYLSHEETVELDWEDPWYSRFTNKNLWRQYNAPINAFLYVEPYEVRVEVIIRPVDLQQWVDLGLAGTDVIPVDAQADLERKVAEFIGERLDLAVDGEKVKPGLDRVHFLRRTLRTSTVVIPREELDVHSATLGVIFVQPMTELPQSATLTWDLFSPKFPEVRSAATDEAGAMPYLLKPDDNRLEWKNFLQNPTDLSPKAVGEPPEKWRLWLRPAGIGCVVIGALVLVLAVAGSVRRRQPSWMPAALGLAILGSGWWMWAAGNAARIDAQIAREVVGKLLYNVYRSFDFRQEEAVYDMLAGSVAGPLLESTYLETRRALVLENQGGAQARVNTVEVAELAPRFLPDGTGFRVDADWVVGGSVGHWGHIHQRRNRYRAELTVEPIAGKWKITGMNVTSEERVQ